MKKIKEIKIFINQKFKNNNQKIINKYYFSDEKEYYKYHWSTDIEMNNSMENIYNSTSLIDGRYYKTIKRLLKLILTDLNNDTLKFDGAFFIINYTNNETFTIATSKREKTLETFQSIFNLKKGGESIANSNKHKNSWVTTLWKTACHRFETFHPLLQTAIQRFWRSHTQWPSNTYKTWTLWNYQIILLQWRQNNQARTL